MTPRLDVELFEIVPVSAGTVLLRLEGRWHSETREPLPMPTLVVDDGRRSKRLASLPGPDATPPQAGPDAELWRASYPTPAGLLDDARIVFALDAGRGIIVDLPAPAPRGQGRRFSRSSGAELAHERTLRAQAERLADERRRALREAEAQLDRERAARATESMRADTAESDLSRIQAELESERDHARADAAQQARDAESAASALAVAQARVRELDEALAAQRRRALEAESSAQTVSADTAGRLAAERQRAAEAIAAQRALAEEATRAQIAAQTQAREHAARAADLELARDELRDQLDQERTRLRMLQAKEVSEETIEERRRSREAQARSETAEARLRQLTAELVALAEERAHLQADLHLAQERIAALEAGPEPAPTPAVVPPEPSPVVAAAAVEAAASAEPQGEALLSIDQPTAAWTLPPEEAPQAPDPEPPSPEEPAALEPAEPAAPEPAEPEPEPSHAVSVFGPFGDAGPARTDRLASEWLEEHIPEAPPEPADPPELPDLVDDGHTYEHVRVITPEPQVEYHDPPRWSADFDVDFDLPAQQSAAARRAARQRAGQVETVPVDEPRGRRAARRGDREVEAYGSASTRQAIVLGVILAALVLVLLKVSGVIGAVTLASL